jgi:DNA-binding NtrC family response regulator
MNIHEQNSQRPLRVLTVDDERISLHHFEGVLKSLGNIEIHPAPSLAKARQTLQKVVLDVAFVDLQLSTDMRNRDGLTLIQEISNGYRTVPIVVSQHGQLNEVSEAMWRGARYYVPKIEFEQQAPTLLDKLRQEISPDGSNEPRADDVSGSDLGLVGTSAAIQELRTLIRKVATTQVQPPPPVLILGPTGSGKELVAEAVHRLGAHPSDPKYDLNCSTLPEQLVESHLFGHEKDAFTGASRDQAGYFTLVKHGTVFLDEVAELSMPLQAKLLRVLESRRFRPLGSTAREQPFHGRIVAATHEDLKKRVRQGLFREDLYYRLNVLPIHFPPLSDRREDIPALIQHLAMRCARQLCLTQELIDLLCTYPWPGNVRELRNAVDRLVTLSDSECIGVQDAERYLSLEFQEVSSGAPSSMLRPLARQILALPTSNKIASMTEALVLEAVDLAGGNNTEAGKRLGRNRKFVERFRRMLARRGSGLRTVASRLCG